MEQHKIDRINMLAKKHKEEGLTSQEHAERKALHSEYIAELKNSMKRQLESISIIEEDGTKRKLRSS